MSLTSELNFPNSPVLRFLQERYPYVDRVTAASRNHLGEMSTLRPSQNVPWPLIGQAIDYRLRFYFPQGDITTRIKSLIAYQGARIACLGRLDWNVAREFFVGLARFLTRVDPACRALEDEDEDTLLRYCVALAAFDVFYRVGEDPRSLLLTPAPKKSLEAILAIARPVWIDDLRALSQGFYDGFADLLDQPVVLNPTFAGSEAIGGADADFVVNHCLVDIKTTLYPLRDTSWVYQTLGYVLLDWDNTYALQEVGVYLARQRQLLRWSLTDLLMALTDGAAPDLATARDEWRAFLIQYKAQEGY